VRLLRTARSLFVHSWFDYEFMVVACLVGFQAMEAAFRVLYPDAERAPFRKLVCRAHQEGILPANIADLAESGAELRNLFSHPATQATLTIGMAGSMLENTHRLVTLVMTAALTSAGSPAGVSAGPGSHDRPGRYQHDGPHLHLTDVDRHHGHHAVAALGTRAHAQRAEVLVVVGKQQARRQQGASAAAGKSAASRSRTCSARGST
jgi:hypothetical protein